MCLFNLVNGKTKDPPSDDELRNAVADILKVVDFKTVRLQTTKICVLEDELISKSNNSFVIS